MVLGIQQPNRWAPAPSGTGIFLGTLQGFADHCTEKVYTLVAWGDQGDLTCGVRLVAEVVWLEIKSEADKRVDEALKA